MGRLGVTFGAGGWALGAGLGIPGRSSFGASSFRRNKSSVRPSTWATWDSVAKESASAASRRSSGDPSPTFTLMSS